MVFAASHDRTNDCTCGEKNQPNRAFAANLFRASERTEFRISFEQSSERILYEIPAVSSPCTDGAKLVTDIDAPIGTMFRLSAVPQAVVRRRCEVVWRKLRTIGVKFTV